MVKTVLGEVNKVERGLFKLFGGSIATRSHHRMEYLRVFLRVLIVKSVGTFFIQIAFSKAFEVFEASGI